MEVGRSGRRTRSFQQLFAELKRRKVFRVMAELPEWFLPAVTLLLAGFPVAVVLAWALEVTPEGVRRADPAAPGEIERIRAQSRAKRWLSGMLALTGAVALVAGAWFAGRQSAEIAGGTGVEGEAVDASIAVLPFADMSPKGHQEYFADGVSEELLNLLAGIPELRAAERGPRPGGIGPHRRVAISG